MQIQQLFILLILAILSTSFVTDASKLTKAEKEIIKAEKKAVKKMKKGMLYPASHSADYEYHPNQVAFFSMRPKAGSHVYKLVEKGKVENFEIFLTDGQMRIDIFSNRWQLAMDRYGGGSLLVVFPEVPETKEYRIVIKRKSRIFGKLFYRTVARSNKITIDKRDFHASYNDFV